MRRHKFQLVFVSILLITTLIVGSCKAASPTTSTTAKATPSSTAPQVTATASSTTTTARATTTSSATTTTAPVTTLKPLPSIIRMLMRPGSSNGAIALGLSGTLTQKLGVKVSIQEVTADLAELTLMRNKGADISLMGSTSIYNPLQGLGDMKDVGPQPLRMIFRGSAQYVVLYTSKKTGIKTYADLKGKRLAYFPGSATINDTVAVLLEAMGLSWDDVKKVNVDNSQIAIDSLKSGVLDVPTVASYPNPNMVEIDATIGLVILPFKPTPEAERILVQKRPTFMMQSVPKGSILGLEEDMRSPSTTNNVYCFDWVDEDLVYQITRATHEVVENTPTAFDSGWRKKDAVAVPFIAPYHPGAVRFYKEVGLWGAEQEKLQQQLLKEEQDRIAAFKAKSGSK